MNNQQIYGKKSELLAKEYLEAKNYQFIEQNWRTKFGEIDLIMRDGETIVFVEVKARRGSSFGLAVEALTRDKQRKLVGLTQLYIQRNRLWNYDYRIDFISIQSEKNNISIEHVINAIELN